jgi:hypothetical protein
MPDKEFKSLLLKLITDLKGIQKTLEWRKSIQDLDEKVRTMDEKFIRDLRFWKKMNKNIGNEW